MNELQKTVVIIYAFVNLIAFVKGYIECVRNKNPYGLSGYLNILGIFVWGDSIVISLFWIISGVVVFYFNDWILFLLIISTFWAIRGIVETIYWLNQQFSAAEKNPPKTLRFHKIFPSDSIWFAYQVFWQCVSVLAIIFSIYFAGIWIK